MNEVYHGNRYDIPADVWEEAVKTVRMLKEMRRNVQTSQDTLDD